MTTSVNERTRFFVKIYLSHFIRKGWYWLCVRGELETVTDCHILTQSSSDHSSTSSSFCWAAQPWVQRAQALCLELVLTPASFLQLELQLELLLTPAVCGTWLYNCLASTFFPWAYKSASNSTTSTGQGDIPSSTGCTCLAVLLLIYTGASLDWRLGPICNISIKIPHDEEIMGVDWFPVWTLKRQWPSTYNGYPLAVLNSTSFIFFFFCSSGPDRSDS